MFSDLPNSTPLAGLQQGPLPLAAHTRAYVIHIHIFIDTHIHMAHLSRYVPLFIQVIGFTMWLKTACLNSLGRVVGCA